MQKYDFRNCKHFSFYLNFCYFSFKEKVTIGSSCLHDRQCSRSKVSGLCSSGVCTCQKGYILIDNNCYQGNKSYGFKLSVIHIVNAVQNRSSFKFVPFDQ